jgi:hypothetical protein
MKQFARANNVAIAKSLDPREVTKALKSTLEVGAALQVPVEEVEKLFYAFLEMHGES